MIEAGRGTRFAQPVEEKPRLALEHRRCAQALRVQNDRQHAVHDALLVRFVVVPRATTGQRAAEQLAGERHAIALVLAEGEHGAERWHHGIARILRRIALGIDQTTERHLVALVVRDAQLSLRHRAGCEIEHERRLARQRHADAARVGSEPGIATAVGRDARMRDNVDEMNRHEALGDRHLGPLANAAKVVDIAKRHDAGARAPGALDRHLHRFAADRLPIALAAVEREQRAGVDRRLRMLIGREAALQHRVDVARDHADAVRVVAEQVRGDEVLGDEARLLGVAAAG